MSLNGLDFNTPTPLSINGEADTSNASSDEPSLQNKSIVPSTFLSGCLDGVKSDQYNALPLTNLKLEISPLKSPLVPSQLPILGLGDPLLGDML